MRYRLIGNTGVRVSEIALGTAMFGVAPDASAAQAVVDRAIDSGINFFDCANSYGNRQSFDRDGMPPADRREAAETILGRAVGSRRDRVLIGSKVQEPVGSGINDRGLSRLHIMQQVEQSLRRLNTDYIDIYHAHHPDNDTALEQTLRAFDDLIAAGKVRYCALSTFPGSQLTEACWIADRRNLAPPISNQVPYSLTGRGAERDVLPACRRHGLSVMVFGALSGGLLAGEDARQRRYSGAKRWGGADFTPTEIAAASALETLARDMGYSAPALAMGWVLRREEVCTIITGAENTAELDANIAAIEAPLPADLTEKVDEIGRTALSHWS